MPYPSEVLKEIWWRSCRPSQFYQRLVYCSQISMLARIDCKLVLAVLAHRYCNMYRYGIIFVYSSWNRRLNCISIGRRQHSAAHSYSFLRRRSYIIKYAPPTSKSIHLCIVYCISVLIVNCEVLARSCEL